MSDGSYKSLPDARFDIASRWTSTRNPIPTRGQQCQSVQQSAVEIDVEEAFHAAVTVVVWDGGREMFPSIPC